MVVRVITLLLAVILMTGAVTQVCAAPDVAAEISESDDALVLDPLILPTVVDVVRPMSWEPAITQAVAASSAGRVHDVFVFRPPR